ncbi:helix-turn-helix domain-containing protein [Nocardia puris]|uniref:PucR family transcriptional regulator n=1 Tax=Nocardia puris TaxID=208602 RepID=UPI0018947310|nr:helix-turn-helix domain-containing protein [Nocardia puris]MBF6212265.1 helix-turn-helix domain-containing protein [Nocardia puris]MBF6366512.1 helix-turn-helix domain-containing protein [Nocardia puris]MBF6460854.1 helix-turn-helix domain-containing protein [Nocardia puris]
MISQPSTLGAPVKTLAAVPISDPLRDTRGLAYRLVERFAEKFAPCGVLPGDVLRGEITAVTRACLEFVQGALEGYDTAEKLERVRRAGADWAREGIPIDVIHRAVHEGFRIGLDLVLDAAAPADLARLVETVRRLLACQSVVDAAFADSYVREHRAAVAEHHAAVHTVASALLAGQPAAPMVRAGGIAIADSYFILAMDIPKHPDEQLSRVDQVVARRKLRRVQSELAVRCSGRALSLLGTGGGTVLLPAAGVTPEVLDELVRGLSSAAQVPLTATVLEAETPDIPEAAERAHELLDMVQRLRNAPGLYRFDDLVVEYQLTRPGPGRERLGEVLDPLDDRPELLETLRLHLGNDLSRQRTARTLGLHANTIDYRLRRIAQLTGLDPAQSSGLWYLRAALVARSYRNAEAGVEMTRARA